MTSADDRRTAIIRLIETRDEGFEDPRGQWSQFGAVAGEKATEKTKCNSCGGDGQLNTRKGLEPCQRCDGRGLILIDAYTREPEKKPPPPAAKVRLGSMSGPERAEWRRRVNAALVRVKEQLAVGVAGPQTLRDELAELNASGGYRWERERRRSRQRYDYPALEYWLEAMRGAPVEIQRARAAVVSVYQYRWVEPTATLEADAGLGLALLERLMPDPIRAPGMNESHPARARIRTRAA